MCKKILLALSFVAFICIGAYAASFDDFMNKYGAPALEQIQQKVQQPTSNPVSGQQGPQNSRKQTDNNQPKQPATQYSKQPEEESYAGHEYTQKKTYEGGASTLGELPAGTLVIDPTSVWRYRKDSNYMGQVVASYPVIWRKFADNHYVQGGTLLVSETNVAHYPFCMDQKGLRAWDESDVRKFLRTLFYSHLSQGFKDAVINVNIPYVDMEGKPKTIVDNFFLLSIVEWGLSDRLNNGKAIDFIDIRDAYPYLEVKTYDEATKTIYFYNENRSWTRTINRPAAKSAGYTSDVFENTGRGTLDTAGYWRGYANVRPAVNIKSTTRVTGPYKQKIEYGAQKTAFVYYALEF